MERLKKNKYVATVMKMCPLNYYFKLNSNFSDKGYKMWMTHDTNVKNTI